MSSSVHFDSKKKDILSHSKGASQRLYDITLTSKADTLSILVNNEKKFVKVCIIMG